MNKIRVIPRLDIKSSNIISGIAGYYIFSEEISLRKIIAYVLIAIGIITLTYSKSADNSRTVLDKKETINLKDVK